MRRVRIGLLTGTVAALALGAGTAQAGPGDPVGCFQAPEGNPTQNVVTVNGFDVAIRPGELPGDADSARAYALAVADGTYGYAWCVQGDTYDIARCWQYKAWIVDHVEVDPATGDVTIHGNDMVARVGEPCPQS